MRDCFALGDDLPAIRPMAHGLARAGYRVHMAGQGAPDPAAVNRALLELDGPVAAQPDLLRLLQACTDRSPWCVADPLLAHALPWWRPLAEGAAVVCVFDHPAAYAERAAAAGEAPVGFAAALRAWTARNGLLLDQHRHSRDWCWVFAPELGEASGAARIQALLEVDASFPAARAPEDFEKPVTAQARRIYEELRGLAARPPPVPRRRPVPAHGPLLSAVALVGPHQREQLGFLADSLPTWNRLQVELILVDQTAEGGLALDGATVVRADTWSRGEAWKRGVAAASGRLVALLDPATAPHPEAFLALARRLDADPDAWMAQGDFRVGEDRVDTTAAGASPPPGWWGAAVLRRGAVAGLSERAFFPSELDLFRRLRAAGRVRHVDEVVHTMDGIAFEENLQLARHEALVLDAREVPGQPEPTLSVIVLAGHGDLRTCLQHLCQQAVPPGTFEILLAGAPEGLPDLPLPWHAVGGPEPVERALAHARGRLVLFLRDDTHAEPDLVRAHLDAHERLAPARVVVMGGVGYVPDVGEAALSHLLETGRLPGTRAELRAGALHPARVFSFVNASLPAEALSRVGFAGAEPAEPGTADLQMGLRLARIGYQVVYQPEARVRRTCARTVDELAERTMAVSRASVALCRDFPELADQFDDPTISVARCDADLGATVALDLRVTATANELSRIDIGAISRTGRSYRALADFTLERLADAIVYLRGRWRLAGIRDGLLAAGAGSVADLLARHPLRPRGARREVWLLHPQRGADAFWTAVVEHFLQVFKATADRTLLLLPEGEGGYPTRVLGESLANLLRRAAVRQGEPLAQVVVAPGRPSAATRLRLLAGADGWIAPESGGDPQLAAWAELLGKPRIAPESWAGGPRAVSNTPPPPFRPVRPLPLAAGTRWRLLAWPRWEEDGELERLMTLVRPLTRRKDVCLCIRHDPAEDGSVQTSVSRLTRAFDRVLGPGADLDVLLVDDALEPGTWPQIGRAVDAALPLDGDRLDFFHALGVPLLASTDEVLGWAARIDRSGGESAAQDLRQHS